MPTTIDINSLAEFVIRHSEANQQNISNLKLQKMLYYLQAYHLAKFDGHPLFNDIPEAWVSGPVYRVIYNKYKLYGGNDISLGFENSKEESYQNSLKKLQLTSDQQQFVQEALDYFGNKTPDQLVIRSHREPPWNEAREGLGPLDYSNNMITHESMRKYYLEATKKAVNKK